MGGRARGRRGASGKGNHRARYRGQGAGQAHAAGALLRRRIPLRAGRRQPAKDGLYRRHFARWRMESVAAGGAAGGEVIDKMLATIIVLVIGIVIGYGIRELISMRRRAK